jgi:hypothetical protein
LKIELAKLRRTLHLLSFPALTLILLVMIIVSLRSSEERRSSWTGPLPTYDTREVALLCDGLNSAWGTDWPQVIASLEKLRERQGKCGGQDPAQTLYPAYYNYGASLEKRGDLTGAITAYRKALEVSPQGGEAIQALLKHKAFTPAPLPQCLPQKTQQALASVPSYSPHGKGDFVRIQPGTSNFYADGRPYRIRGINYYPMRAPWRRFLTESEPTSVAKELDLIAGAGFNTLRIFLWYEALFDCPGSGAVPKPEAIARLDNVIRLSAARGLRLIVTLNDLPDLTIRPLYREPEPAAAQTAYIVSRYGNEPAILAWDLRNEGDIDIMKGFVSQSTVMSWLRQTAQQVRQLDPNHLLTAGWNQDSHMTIDVVDFVSFHHWSSAELLRLRIAAFQAQTRKPILLQEVGYSAYGAGEARQGDRLRDVINAANSTGLAGWMIWTAFDFPTDVTCIAPACPSKDNSEHHFGLWRTDYTPKSAVNVIKSLITPIPGQPADG